MLNRNLFNSFLVGAGGFFLCLEVAKVYFSAFYFYYRLPFFVFVSFIFNQTRSDDFSFSVPLLVTGIFTVSYYSEIRSSIIKRISVDVVNLHFVKWVSNYGMVKKYIFMLSRLGKRLNCISMFFGSLKTPIQLGKMCVAIIDDCGFSLRQRYFNHGSLYHGEIV